MSGCFLSPKQALVPAVPAAWAGSSLGWGSKRCGDRVMTRVDGGVPWWDPSGQGNRGDHSSHLSGAVGGSSPWLCSLGLSSGTLSTRAVQAAAVLRSLPASSARIPSMRPLAITLAGAAGCGEN